MSDTTQYTSLDELAEAYDFGTAVVVHFDASNDSPDVIAQVRAAGVDETDVQDLPGIIIGYTFSPEGFPVLLVRELIGGNTGPTYPNEVEVIEDMDAYISELVLTASADGPAI
jgi:hypothetical protein